MDNAFYDALDRAPNRAPVACNPDGSRPTSGALGGTSDLRAVGGDRFISVSRAPIVLFVSRRGSGRPSISVELRDDIGPSRRSSRCLVFALFAIADRIASAPEGNQSARSWLCVARDLASRRSPTMIRDDTRAIPSDDST